MSDKAMLFSMLAQTIGTAADDYQRRLAESQSYARMNAETNERRTAFENAKAYADPKYAEMTWEDFKQSNAYKRPEYGHLDHNEAKARMAEFELKSEEIHYGIHKEHTDKKLLARLTGDFFTGYKEILKQNGGSVANGDADLSRLLTTSQQTAQELGLSSTAWGDAILNTIEAELTHGRWGLAEHVMENHQDLFNDADQLNRAWGLKRMMQTTKKNTLSREWDIEMDTAQKDGNVMRAAELTKEAGFYHEKRGNDYVQVAVGNWYKKVAMNTHMQAARQSQSFDVMYNVTDLDKVDDTYWKLGGDHNPSATEVERDEGLLNLFDEAVANGTLPNFLNRSQVVPPPIQKVNKTLETLDTKEDGEFYHTDQAKRLYAVVKGVGYDGSAAVAKMNAEGRSARIIRRFADEKQMNPDKGDSYLMEQAVKKVESNDKRGEKLFPEAFPAMSTDSDFLLLDEPRQYLAMMRFKENILDHDQATAVKMAMKDADARSLDMSGRMVWDGAYAKAKYDRKFEEAGIEVNTELALAEMYEDAVKRMNTKLLRKDYELDEVSIDDIAVEYNPATGGFMVRSPISATSYVPYAASEIMEFAKKAEVKVRREKARQSQQRADRGFSSALGANDYSGFGK